MTSKPPKSVRDRRAGHPIDVVDYQLLDFGNGKKYERLGDYHLIRPSPAATSAPPSTSWDVVDASFERSTGRWNVRRRMPEKSRVRTDAFSMPVSLRPSGHLGVFFEQASNWRWLTAVASNLAADRHAVGQPRAMNLFGYTGASSVAIARGGVPVVHVDASKPTVQDAKRAAAIGGVESRIQFWVDDALKVLRREDRRGRRYDIVVMDPPAYGHAPNGVAWRLEKNLSELLEAAKQIVADDFALLLTGHSDGFGVPEATAAVSRVFSGDGDPRLRFRGRRMHLESTSGRRLDCGFQLRVTTERLQQALHSRSDSMDAIE